MYLWISTLALVLVTAGRSSGQCHFNQDTPLNSKTPLVIYKNKNKPDILSSYSRNGSQVDNHGRIQFFCSGYGNFLFNRRIGALVNARCVNRQFQLDYDGKKYHFAQLQCLRPPTAEARVIGKCHTKYQKILIGFAHRQFIPKIELCFDAKRRITYWTKHALKHSTYSCDFSNSANFKKNFFGRLHVDSIYKSHARTYDRGYLTPKCDFATSAEKRMTFYYVNAAPQISQFNRRNWRDLEGVIRSIASRRMRQLYIYTGGGPHPTSLDGKIPVPLYFWKVVIDKKSREGVAFVGINVNEKKNCPCAGIKCETIVWLSDSFRSKMSDYKKGKICCCTIQSLKSIPNTIFPSFPEFSGHTLVNL